MPDFSCIPMMFHDRAQEALDARDVVGLLVLASNDYSLQIVYGNVLALRKRGMLEAAFIHAVTGCRVNNHHEYRLIRSLLSIVDRERLRSAGTPLPGAGPFTLYRGAAGVGAARRVRGYSWTSDLERARWFADRFAGHLAQPAVYRTVVPAELVLFHSQDREESEFFVDLPVRHPVKRLK